MEGKNPSNSKIYYPDYDIWDHFGCVNVLSYRQINLVLYKMDDVQYYKVHSLTLVHNTIVYNFGLSECTRVKICDGSSYTKNHSPFQKLGCESWFSKQFMLILIAPCS